MAKEKIESKPARPAPEPAPKIGDKVNFVVPHTKKIIPLEVLSVPADLDGRQVIVNLDGPPGKDGKVTAQRLAVPFRDANPPVGGTWHWPAKVAALLLAILLGLTAQVQAAIPTYRTVSAVGNATAPAQVYFPANTNAQARVVSVWYASDTNTAALQFSTGGTAYTQVATNAASTSITNLINTTNGLQAGSVMLLEWNGNPYTNTLVSYGSYITGTNTFGQTLYQPFMVLGSGGWGVALTNAWQNIYEMSSISSLPVGANTNAINGDAIYVGNYGRPVWLQLSSALKTNQIPAASAHYDQLGQ